MTLPSFVPYTTLSFVSLVLCRVKVNFSIGLSPLFSFGASEVVGCALFGRAVVCTLGTVRWCDFTDPALPGAGDSPRRRLRCQPRDQRYDIAHEGFIHCPRRDVHHVVGVSDQRQLVLPVATTIFAGHTW